MARVTILLPKVLDPSIGTSRIRVEARTLAAALEEAYRRHPALRFHLCEDSGAFRVHVLCFHNGNNARDLDVPLDDGDEISILQAISGG